MMHVQHSNEKELLSSNKNLVISSISCQTASSASPAPRLIIYSFVCLFMHLFIHVVIWFLYGICCVWSVERHYWYIKTFKYIGWSVFFLIRYVVLWKYILVCEVIFLHLQVLFCWFTNVFFNKMHTSLKQVFTLLTKIAKCHIVHWVDVKIIAEDKNLYVRLKPIYKLSFIITALKLQESSRTLKISFLILNIIVVARESILWADWRISPTVCKFQYFILLDNEMWCEGPKAVYSQLHGFMIFCALFVQSYKLLIFRLTWDLLNSNDFFCNYIFFIVIMQTQHIKCNLQHGSLLF